MGYDTHYQLIDPDAVTALIGALGSGTAPPPSPFDRAPDAEQTWAEVGRAVRGDDAAHAARSLAAFVVEWSSHAHPHVVLRNFGVTHHPLRMEDALEGVPSGAFGSPRGLLAAADRIRPGLPDLVPSVLEGQGSTGGYVADPWSAAQALQEFLDDLAAPELQRRLVPLLALLRAAQRDGLTVWEAENIGRGSVGAERLRSRGLERFVLDGPPLRADEWNSIAQHPPETAVDLSDLLRRVVEVSPLSTELVPSVQRALAAIEFAGCGARAGENYADRLVLTATKWLGATLEHRALRAASIALIGKLERALRGAESPVALPASPLLEAISEAGTPQELADVQALFGSRLGAPIARPGRSMPDAVRDALAAARERQAPRSAISSGARGPGPIAVSTELVAALASLRLFGGDTAEPGLSMRELAQAEEGLGNALPPWALALLAARSSVLSKTWGLELHRALAHRAALEAMAGTGEPLPAGLVALGSHVSKAKGQTTTDYLCAVAGECIVVRFTASGGLTTRSMQPRSALAFVEAIVDALRSKKLLKMGGAFRVKDLEAAAVAAMPTLSLTE